MSVLEMGLLTAPWTAWCSLCVLHPAESLVMTLVSVGRAQRSATLRVVKLGPHLLSTSVVTPLRLLLSSGPNATTLLIWLTNLGCRNLRSVPTSWLVSVILVPPLKFAVLSRLAEFVPEAT